MSKEFTQGQQFNEPKRPAFQTDIYKLETTIDLLREEVAQVKKILDNWNDVANKLLRES